MQTVCLHPLSGCIIPRSACLRWSCIHRFPCTFLQAEDATVYCAVDQPEASEHEGAAAPGEPPQQQQHAAAHALPNGSARADTGAAAAASAVPGSAAEPSHDHSPALMNGHASHDQVHFEFHRSAALLYVPIPRSTVQELECMHAAICAATRDFDVCFCFFACYNACQLRLCSPKGYVPAWHRLFAGVVTCCTVAEPSDN